MPSVNDTNIYPGGQKAYPSTTLTATNIAEPSSGTVNIAVSLNNTGGVTYFVQLLDGPGEILPNGILFGASGSNLGYINPPSANTLSYLSWENNAYQWSEIFNSPVFTGTPTAPTPLVSDNSTNIATTAYVKENIAAIGSLAESVTSVAGRTGAIVLSISDITGGAPLASPTFTGTPTAPSPSPSDNTNTIATTEFVHQNISLLGSISGAVTSVNGQVGSVSLSISNIAGAAPIASPVFTGIPQSVTTPISDNSTNIATTAYVKENIAAIGGVTTVAGRSGAVVLSISDVSGAAPLASPAFTGTPTAPSPAVTDNSNTIATTEFVKQNILVSSVAGRTGSIVLAVTDIAGAAPIASPLFTGTPQSVTPTITDNSTNIATTAYVQDNLVNYVSSVNGRTGIISLSLADIPDAASLVSPNFSGNPTAPTQITSDNSTNIATTAFVKQNIAAINSGVTSVAGRTGAVVLSISDISGGAPLASPAFTGTPLSVTPTSTDNSTKIATTAFVKTAISNLGTLSGAVTSVAGRIGAVVLSISDISGGAPLASPVFTGTPQSVTPSLTDNSKNIATTSYVQGNLSAFNSAIGLTSGTYTPSSTANYINSSVSVNNALGILDNVLFATNTSLKTTNTIAGNVLTSVGLNSDGTKNSYSSTNYLTNSSSILAGMGILDNQLFLSSASIINNSTAITNNTNILSIINSNLGFSSTGVQPNYSSTKYITNAQSLTSSIGTLDGVIASQNQSTVNAIILPFNETSGTVQLGTNSFNNITVLKVKFFISSPFASLTTISVNTTGSISTNLIINGTFDFTTTGVSYEEIYEPITSATTLNIDIAANGGSLGTGVVIVEYVNQAYAAGAVIATNDILLENGSGNILLENGSGYILVE